MLFCTTEEGPIELETSCWSENSVLRAVYTQEFTHFAIAEALQSGLSYHFQQARFRSEVSPGACACKQGSI